MINVFQMASGAVVDSHLQPSSQTVPASPERPSAPRRTCPARPLFLSASSAGRAARPPAEVQEMFYKVTEKTRLK